METRDENVLGEERKLGIGNWGWGCARWGVEIGDEDVLGQE